MAGPPRRVLVVGGRGMLGRAWAELLARRGIAHRAAGSDELDVTDPQQVASISGYDAIVNAAAYTAVDDAETHEAEAMKLNADAVALLAARAKAIGATLVHYSTDYVFSGDATRPYRVDEPRAPINAYGRTKARGEALLEQSVCDYRLIRTSWLYAPWGNNFVRTMLRLTREKPVLRVVADQRGRPTSARHLADASLALLERAPAGTYHVTDGGACTWCDFARAVNDLAGHACDVQPCTTADFPRPAPRPAYSVLDLTGTEAILGPMPDWSVNLKSVLTALQEGQD